MSSFYHSDNIPMKLIFYWVKLYIVVAKGKQNFVAVIQNLTSKSTGQYYVRCGNPYLYGRAIIHSVGLKGAY